MEVDHLCFRDLGEEALGGIRVVEDVVDEHFAHDKAGNDHRDVLFAQFNGILQKALVALDA